MEVVILVELCNLVESAVDRERNVDQVVFQIMPKYARAPTARRHPSQRPMTIS